MFLLVLALVPALLAGLLFYVIRSNRAAGVERRRLSQQVANVAGLLLAAGFKPPSHPHWLDDWHKTHLR